MAWETSTGSTLAPLRTAHYDRPGERTLMGGSDSRKDGLAMFLTSESLPDLGCSPQQVAVTVLAPSNQSEFVSQTVPKTMSAGEAYNVTITMKNIGALSLSEGKCN
jgi:hypothetical protein